MNHSSRLLIVAACVALPAAPALAFELRPISRVFAPSGSQATQSFEVRNDGSRDRIAVEVSIWTMQRDDDYVESNRPADDEFLVYPPQIILAPGARQMVRVTWVGDANPARELAFRIVAEQLPIALPQAADADQAVKPVGGLRVLLTFRGTMFIRPRKAQPQVSLRSAEPATTPQGARALAVTLVNTGAAHGRLERCSLRVSSGAPAISIDLPAAEMKPMLQTRVLAGSRRRYLLAWPRGLPAGPLTATGRCDLES
jgi:fimbrial chaperone protein